MPALTLLEVAGWLAGGLAGRPWQEAVDGEEMKQSHSCQCSCHRWAFAAVDCYCCPLCHSCCISWLLSL